MEYTYTHTQNRVLNSGIERSLWYVRLIGRVREGQSIEECILYVTFCRKSGEIGIIGICICISLYFCKKRLER